MTETLSVVIPAFNASRDIGNTIRALVAALERAPAFEPEIVLVDDGSADETGESAIAACAGRFPLRVVSQPNLGRFEARRRGLNDATGEWVLLLDSRVTLDQYALEFVYPRLADGADVWNGHVHVADGGSIFGIFWRLLAELAWSDYFDDPRETNFGIEEFDRYPKGTGCFLARRSELVAAVCAFEAHYSDLRSANDDTRLIRWLAERARIHLSPNFSCVYKPRTAPGPFMRHAIHRGVVFLDGHSSLKSRFFPAVIGFYPLSIGLLVASRRRPISVPLTTSLAIGTAAAGLAVRHRRTRREVGSLLVTAPMYAAGHGLGMWKGLFVLVRDALRRS